MEFIIAVDGPAASGKGTVASALARHYGFAYLDTGLLYRFVGYANADGMPLDMVLNLDIAGSLDDPELLSQLRTRRAGGLASKVAALPKVWAALLGLQKQFAGRKSGAVLDGRDIGTVIAPHAPAKLFVTARPEVRAMRRWKQLAAQGETPSFDEVLADIAVRDKRDSHRAAAPLVMAADAALLDTSEMTIDHAFREALRLVELSRGASKGR